MSLCPGLLPDITLSRYKQLSDYLGKIGLHQEVPNWLNQAVTDNTDITRARLAGYPNIVIERPQPCKRVDKDLSVGAYVLLSISILSAAVGIGLIISPGYFDYGFLLLGITVLCIVIHRIIFHAKLHKTMSKHLTWLSGQLMQLVAYEDWKNVWNTHSLLYRHKASYTAIYTDLRAAVNHMKLSCKIENNHNRKMLVLYSLSALAIVIGFIVISAMFFIGSFFSYISIIGGVCIGGGALLTGIAFYHLKVMRNSKSIIRSSGANMGIARVHLMKAQRLMQKFMRGIVAFSNLRTEEEEEELLACFRSYSCGYNEDGQFFPLPPYSEEDPTQAASEVFEDLPPGYSEEDPNPCTQVEEDMGSLPPYSEEDPFR